MYGIIVNLYSMYILYALFFWLEGAPWELRHLQDGIILWGYRALRF